MLLNNDAVVTDGWLEQLIGLARVEAWVVKPSEGPEDSSTTMLQNGSAIGLVGPMTNCAPPPQLIERVPYRDLDEMHAFAQSSRRGAPRTMVYRSQALGFLRAHEAGSLRGDQRAR